EKHSNEGFVILGFPCNQFGGQEPGTEEQIKSFCELNYQVTFPLFEKLEVNGENTHPLYKYLKTAAKGLLGTEAIKWNFTKFLINRQGQVVDRFSPSTEPGKIDAEIVKCLAE